MKVRLLTNGEYCTTTSSIGKVVEATKLGEGINVTAEELRRVGAKDAAGSDYPYFSSEFEVVEE